MMTRITWSLTIVVFFLASPASVALAASTGATGQPNQSCQSQPASPGQAASAPGAAFNEPTATSPGGIAGMKYAGNGQTLNTPASPNAVSQYDVACFQVSTQLP